MTSEDVVVFDARDPATGGRGWWAAKCKHCGQFITKYDHSPEECLALALEVGCPCRREPGSPTRCAQCGASLAGTGPLVAAWLETTNGDAVCSSECAS